MPRLASHCWWSRWNGDKELTTKCRNKQLRRWPHPVFEELFERFWERKTIRKLAGYCMLMSSILRILCGLGQGLTSWCWFRLELLELKPFPEDGANLGKPLPHPSPKPILPGCQAARPMPYRGPESIMIRKERCGCPGPNPWHTVVVWGSGQTSSTWRAKYWAWWLALICIL